MPARPHFAHGINGQGVHAGFQRRQEFHHHLDQIAVQHKLLEARHQPPLQPPCPVHDHVAAAHGDAPEREHALIGGLRIHRVGSTGVRGAVRHLVAPRQLPAHHAGLHVFRRAKRRRSRFHVHIRGEAAIDEGRTFAHQLRERHSRQRLGILLDQRPRHGHWRHGAGQGEGGHAHNLVARRHFNDAAQHGVIKLQRRIGVDDGEQRWFALQLLMRDSAGDAGDLDAVADALGAQRIGVERLVGQRHNIAQGFEMADRGMHIGGLHRIACDKADAIEKLRQFQKLLIVGPVAAAPAAIKVRTVGRAADSAEHHGIAAHALIILGIARMEIEFSGRCGNHLFNHGGIKAHPLAIKLGTGILQNLARLGQIEIHANFRQHLQRSAVNGFKLIGGDDAHRRKGPRNPGSRQLRNRAPGTGGAPPGAVTAAAARGLGA